ncbi:uncharacterized protein PITG_03622 [Phytophthora infestans T30-4]|uniref:Uncharacterized protein n=1 Tax=Phytophthora infestans (strain T30-4) TaxID=403677 RepID=D0MY32_PHYIT|nr:uncharacterized protein PITG_03622 [Phytophthora infestans T30-4]EEY66080.1 conserved hypothetical protein [Phytophthora infestans T30-4]|eukprot:XP_002906679.1 conserved hypothetical protein [Phytophthora infestans T30-4]
MWTRRHEAKLRLLKAKFLLQQQLKVDRTAKNRRMLEILCEGLRCCTEAEGERHELAAEFRKYFGVKLKACLVKMHATTVMAKYSKDNSGANIFAENLKYLRATLPNYVDKNFLLWLVEVTCHTAITSFQPDSTAEMHQLVAFGQEFFDKVALEHPVSREFRMHHLIITGFYYLRIGKVTKVAPLLDQIQVLGRGTRCGDQPLTGAVEEAYLTTILDSMRVAVLAYSDPKQAVDLATKTTLAAQANLKKYDKYRAVRLMLIATLFDTLYVYCRQLGVQCRYADMGAAIVQMTTLFAKYKSDLERTIFYRYFLARCHTLIAKYNLALAKWMWATERLPDDVQDSNAARSLPYNQHGELEELRPKALTLLHEALLHMNTSVICCETTSEIMALFGPQLVAFGKMEEGETMLMNAIGTSLQSKNVLLQARLLADVFQLYATKGLVAAQATAASKYEKKVALLQRRIAAAQAEKTTTAALLRWTAVAKASKPSSG